MITRSSEVSHTIACVRSHSWLLTREHVKVVWLIKSKFCWWAHWAKTLNANQFHGGDALAGALNNQRQPARGTSSARGLKLQVSSKGKVCVCVCVCALSVTKTSFHAFSMKRRKHQSNWKGNLETKKPQVRNLSSPSGVWRHFKGLRLPLLQLSLTAKGSCSNTFFILKPKNNYVTIFCSQTSLLSLYSILPQPCCWPAQWWL